MKNAQKAAGFVDWEPERRIVVALSHLSVREFIQAAVVAAGRAAAQGGPMLRVEHLPAAVLSELEEIGSDGSSKREAELH